KPFLLKEIIYQGYATNIKSAKNYFESKDPAIYDILEKVVQQYPILLNRAPTLHKLSILAFYPVLTDDIAIHLHPCVCQGYNADFDGDAMGVFIPLSKKAIEEAKTYMLPSQNLLKPADGSLIAIPNKEMVLGLYYLTTIDVDKQDLDNKSKKAFGSMKEVMIAYELEKVELREPILLKKESKIIETSVGRVILNLKLPESMRFINYVIKATNLKDLIKKALGKMEQIEVANLIDELKDLGFQASTYYAGASFSVLDCIIYDKKEQIVKEAEEATAEIEKTICRAW
ncbi:unnamed protein product, partial [marine sediment metagenome]